MSIKKKEEIQFDNVKEGKDLKNNVEENQLSEIDELRKQIEELKSGYFNSSEGKVQIFGSKHTGKLWGFKIILSPRSPAYKNLNYLDFSINGRKQRINFNEPTDVEIGIYETIEMHEKINKMFNEKTKKIDDKNVHYVAQKIGEIYK